MKKKEVKKVREKSEKNEKSETKNERKKFRKKTEEKKGKQVYKYQNPANITLMVTYYQYEGNMVQWFAHLTQRKVCVSLKVSVY